MYAYYLMVLQIQNPSLKLVLSLLRLACHDSDVFCKFKSVRVPFRSIFFGLDKLATEDITF